MSLQGRATSAYLSTIMATRSICSSPAQGFKRAHQGFQSQVQVRFSTLGALQPWFASTASFAIGRQRLVMHSCLNVTACCLSSDWLQLQSRTNLWQLRPKICLTGPTAPKLELSATQFAHRHQACRTYCRYTCVRALSSAKVWCPVAQIT